MSLSVRRPPAARAAAIVEAESWFLKRGLPSVLTMRGRCRRLWPRSAPMLAAWAVVEGCLMAVFFVTDGGEVFISATPTTAQWVILALLAVALPLASLVGWLVSQISSGRGQAAVATMAVAFAAASDVIESGPIQLLRTAVVVGLVLLQTGCGVGSVLGWAVRMTLEHLATVGTLAVRALPIVLLTALVFFNTYVWLMAANINGERLTLAMVFLLAIAGAFVVSKTVERVRPLLRSTTVMPQGSQSLAGTPFATMGDPSPGFPLTRAERLNVDLPAGGLATRRDPGSGVGRRRDIPRSGHDHSHSAAASGMDALRFDDHDGARHDVPGAGFAHPYVSFPGRADVHVHQRPRGRRRRVPRDVPRPSDRRPAHRAARAQPLPQQRGDRAVRRC